MVRYVIFDKKCVHKKGLNKCFFRSSKNKKDAKTYVSNDPSSYIIKKMSEKEYRKL